MKKNFTIVIILILIVTACNLETFDPIVSSKYTLKIVSGNEQLNAISQQDLLAFVIEVRDTSSGIPGQPVVGQEVRFEVKEGSGRFQGNISITVPTNASGQASVKLTMGTTLLELTRIEVRLTGATSNPALVTFTALADRFKDSRDSEIYPVVKLLDGKVWLAKNMEFLPASSNSWCYDDLVSNCNQYGRLYSWSVAKSACPSGWHLPTRMEIDNLISAYGGLANTYNALIEGGNSGFDALLSGYRFTGSPEFREFGNGGFFWTSTETSTNEADYLYFQRSGLKVLLADTDKLNGFSCRCIQN